METVTSDEAVARGGTYHLLARIWIREIDIAFLRQLRSPALCRSFQEAGGVVPANGDGQTIEELSIDYCQLFVGPQGHLPLVQSVWVSGQYHGDATTASMKRFVELTSYDTHSLPKGTMLDHFGVQLDLMGLIVGQLATCSTQRETVSDIAKAFFRAHLLWSYKVLESVAGRASIEFYRSAATVTRAFLDSEMRA